MIILWCFSVVSVLQLRPADSARGLSQLRVGIGTSHAKLKAAEFATVSAAGSESLPKKIGHRDVSNFLTVVIDC